MILLKRIMLLRCLKHIVTYDLIRFKIKVLNQGMSNLTNPPYTFLVSFLLLCPHSFRLNNLLIRAFALAVPLPGRPSPRIPTLLSGLCSSAPLSHSLLACCFSAQHVASPNIICLFIVCFTPPECKLNELI